MGQEINIQVLVDAPRIMDQMRENGFQPAPADDPFSLQLFDDTDRLIYMIAPRDAIYQSAEGDPELEIKAETGDTIIWHMNTFGNCADYSVYLYWHYFYLAEGEPPLGLANPGYFRQTVGLWLPYEGEDPNVPNCPLEPVLDQHYTFSADVVSIDQLIDYLMCFRMVDNASGESLGYFCWSPKIRIPF